MAQNLVYLPRSSPSIAITNPKSTLGLLKHISIFSLGPNTAEVPQFTNFQSLCLSSLSLPPSLSWQLIFTARAAASEGLGIVGWEDRRKHLLLRCFVKFASRAYFGELSQPFEKNQGISYSFPFLDKKPKSSKELD